MGQRFLRHSLTGLLCTALVVLIGLARGLEIDFDDRTAPIASSGDLGETVDAGTFTLTVENVQLASTVVTEDDGTGIGELDEDPLEDDPDTAGTEGTAQGMDAEGIWVVAEATVTASDENLRVHGPALLDVADDLSYGSVSLPTTLEESHIAPGIPMSGVFLFEVPEGKLRDPELRVVAAGLDSRLGGEAAVDLDLGATEVETLVSEISDPVTIPAATT